MPGQDKQYLVGFAQLPDGATLDRTEDVIRRMSDIALKQPGVESAVAFPGLSINGFTNSSNAGIVFVTLKPFDERTDPGAERRRPSPCSSTRSSAPSRMPSSPCSRRRRCRGSAPSAASSCRSRIAPAWATTALDEATKAFMAKAAKAPELAGLFSSFQVNVPQLYADIDRIKARQLGVAVTDVFETMQIYLGSLYVNDFNKFGRTYSVRVQADAQFRARADDVGQLKVRSNSGEMVPLAALLRVQSSAGPERAMRYNGFLVGRHQRRRRAGLLVRRGAGRGGAHRRGNAAEGLRLRVDRADLSGNPRRQFGDLWCSRSPSCWCSWCWPRCTKASRCRSSIIMIVPMGLLAAMAGVWLTDGDNNIFTQIGLIVLVGLSAKNAILIVEFARELEFAGRTPRQAAIEASRLRLRPILMTSLAFIMGVLPLVISTGAGAEMRHAMGVAVFAGMIGVTAFGIFLTPVFYVLLRGLTGNRPLKQHGEAAHAAMPGPQHPEPAMRPAPGE